MMYDSDEALDAALFALPLELPPSGLRTSILAATVLRPAAALGVWEVAASGVLAAVLVWFVALVAIGGGGLFLDTISLIGVRIGQGLSNISTLAWLAAGAATALWLCYFTGPHHLGVLLQRARDEAADK